MTAWPQSLTPDAWTVWVTDEGSGAPRQVGWATRRRVAERLFDLDQRDPGQTVALHRPAEAGVADMVGDQVAAVGP